MPKHYASDYEILTGVAPGNEGNPADEAEYESVLVVPETPAAEPKRSPRKAAAKTEQE